MRLQLKAFRLAAIYKYTRNGKKVIAENDTQGLVTYELYNDGKNISIDDREGQQILSDAIKNMIDVVFDAKARLERFYKKGGVRARC